MKKILRYVIILGFLALAIAFFQTKDINIPQIDNLKQKSSIEFNASAKEDIADALNNIDSIGESIDGVWSETSEKIKEYGEEASSKMEEKFVKTAEEAAAKTAHGFWQKMRETIQKIL